MRGVRGILGGVFLCFPLAAACSDGASDQIASPAAGASGQAGSKGSGASAGVAGTSAGRGGAGQGGGTAGSAGTSAGGQAGTPCTTSTECVLAATVPAGCAVGTCTGGTCVYAAADVDGDGHPTANCKTSEAGMVVKLGDDCDDKDPKTFPGAWDGPAADGNESACNDGVDQDCSGAVDDGKSSAGGTCICTPGDVRACAENSAGKTIVFPVVKAGETPLGECRRGAQTCLAAGSWGPCTDVVEPSKEECNDKDDDCDGKVDLTGETVPGDADFWLYDGDDDLHASTEHAAKQSCKAPPTGPCADQALCPGANAAGESHWRRNIPKDDCLDTDKGVHPGAAEVCNGKDDDCNPGTADATATGNETWFWDGDRDGFVSEDEAANGIKSCTNPGDDVANCRGATEPCPTSFIGLSSRGVGNDCDDADAAIFPGAWDGPAGVGYGLDPNGLALRFYDQPATPPGALGPEGVPFTTNAPFGDAALRAKTISFDWWKRGPVAGHAEHFAAEAKGQIVAPQTGVYTFHVRLASNSVRVAIGGTNVINVADLEVDDALPLTEGIASLVANTPTDIVIQLVQDAGAAGLILEWSGPGVTRQILTARSPSDSAAQPNRCDGVQQNCGAAEPDATNRGNRTCADECFPGTVGSCGATYKQGLAAASICVPGSRTCTAAGRWGACNGAAGPSSEVCGNGKDDDCNGTIDENNTVYYEDQDHDGYGDPASTKSGCGLGSDWVANKDDCAPSDAKIKPGAADICNGIDDNCSGGADEGWGIGTDCNYLGSTVGACRNGGRWACETNASGRKCVAKDPTLGLAKSPTIPFPDYWHATPAPWTVTSNTRSYDWTCNNGEEKRFKAEAGGITDCPDHDAKARARCAEVITLLGCNNARFYSWCTFNSTNCGADMREFTCKWNDSTKKCSPNASPKIVKQECR